MPVSIEAPTALARFVAAFRVTTPPMTDINRLPDGTTTFLFRLHEPERGAVEPLRRSCG